MRALNMKKRGFTLAEVLISLGIVAIVAALAAPSLLNLMPDKNKLKVIKAHKILSDVTSELLNDPIYYRDYESSEGTETYQRPGLSSWTNDGNLYPYLIAKAGAQVGNYVGTKKYCYLLSEKLELNGSITKSSNKYIFTTLDGIEWACEFEFSQDTTNKIYLTDYTITIDLDGPDKGENSIAKSGVKRPDQFQFKVDTYGKVTGVDTLTKNYLKNNMKLNDRDNDYKNTGM